MSSLKPAVHKGSSPEIDMLIQLTKGQPGSIAKLIEYEDKAVQLSNFSKSLPILVHTGNIDISSVLDEFMSDVFGNETAQ